MKTLQVISFFLTYPSQNMLEATDEAMSVLTAEGWLSPVSIEKIGSFLQNLSRKDLYDAQEEYVGLFDRTPSLCLYLFEHVHGDSRDRGQAMVELDMLYRESGLENLSEHTPDYLPLFLEYVSTLPPDKMQDTLDGVVDIIAVLGERLKKRESGYAVLMDALLEASIRKPDPKKLQSALMLNEGRELTSSEMDEAWEQQFAFSDAQGGNDGACPKVQDMLKRMETGS